MESNWEILGAHGDWRLWAKPGGVWRLTGWPRNRHTVIEGLSLIQVTRIRKAWAKALGEEF